MREIVGGRDPHDSFCHLSFNHSALSSPPPPPFMGHMVSHSRKKKTLAFDQEMSSVPPPPHAALNICNIIVCPHKLV